MAFSNPARSLESSTRRPERWCLPGGLCFLLGLLFLGAGVLAPPAAAQGPFPMDPSAVSPGTGMVFPENRQLRRLLRNAEQAVEEKNYAEAVALLSRVLAHPEDFFFRPQKNAATYVSLKAAARRMLVELPPPGREAFRLRFEGDARRLLRRGLEQNDPALLAQAARRYFLAPSGVRATWHLARMHVDSGQVLAAAVLLDQMAQLPMELRKGWEPDLSLLRAACHLVSGQEDRAQQVLESLRQRFPKLQLAGASGPVRLWELDASARNAALVQLVPQSSRHAPPGRFWPYPGGEPARVAEQTASLDLVLRQWRAEFYDDYFDRTAPPGTYSDRGLTAILNRVVTQANQQGSRLLIGEPLILGDVVVVRTLTQLIALEGDTGRRLWEHSRDELLLELLAQLDGRKQMQPVPVSEPIPAPGGIGVIPDQFFRWRLFADRTYLTLSSDGQAVFCVEPVAPRSGSSSGPRPPRPPGPPMPWQPPFGGLGLLGDPNVNRLAAYDLQTGKLLWQLGGHTEDKTPLAGYFFQGPPLPLDGMLYLLAEQRGEIRLLALHASPGHRRPPRLVWSQPLGHAQYLPGESLRAFFRATSGLAPTFAQGLLLCPTDAGVLVALEPTARQLRWGFVYKQSRNRRRPRPPRGGRLCWLDSLVRVYGQRVLLTPRDENWLYCLDLHSGRLLWKIPRGDNRLLLAADARGILLQADRALQLVDWDGKSRWMKRFSTRGTTTGRALVTRERVYVPLSDGTLLAVDRRSGRELPQATFHTRSAQDPFAAEEQIELGSFVASGEVVLCLGVFGLERLENLRQLQARLTRQLQQHPQDVDTLLVAAEVYRRLKQWDQALEVLDRAYRLQQDTQTRRLLVSTLMEALEADFPRFQKHISRLRRLAVEPPQRTRLLRICATGYHQHGQPERALELYLELLQLASSTSQLQQVEKDRWAQQGVWVVSQLRRLSQKLSPAQQNRLRKQLDRYVQQYRGDPERLAAVLELLGQPEQLHQLRRRWLEHAPATTAAQRLRRDYHLLRLSQADDPRLAGWATATLAQEYRRLGLTDEAAWCYEQLQQRFAEVECLGGKTGKQLVQQLQPEEAVYRRLHWNGWPDRALKLRRKLLHPQGQRGEKQREYAFGPLEVVSQEPWARLVRCQVEWGPGQRLVARNRFGRVLWAAQLVHPQTRQVLRTYPGTVAALGGHVLVLPTADYLVAIDTMGSQVEPPGQILWMHPFSTPNSLVQTQLYVAETNYPWGQPLRVFRFRGFADSVVQRAVVSGNRVFFQQDDAVVALDLFTGRPLWKRKGFYPGRSLFADSQHLLVGPTPYPKKRLLLLDARDGSMIDPNGLEPECSLDSVRGMAGIRWTLPAGKTEVSRIHLITRQVLWKRQFPPHTVFCFRWPYMAAVDPQRNLTLWDVETGKLILKQALPLPRGTNIWQIDLFEHVDAWILVVEPYGKDRDDRQKLQQLRNGQAHLIGRQILRGQLVVLDRQTGRLRWWRPVENLFLAPYQAPDHPLLVLGNSLIVRRRVGPGRVQLQMISDFYFLDKRTGKLLWDVRVNNRRNPWFDLADMANPLARTIRWRNALVTTTWEFDPQELPPKGETTPLAPRTEEPQQQNPPPGPGPNSLPPRPGATPRAHAASRSPRTHVRGSSAD